MNKIKNIQSLIKQYIIDLISIDNLTKMYNCSSHQIRNILNKNNIHIRNLKEAHCRKRINFICEYCNRPSEKRPSEYNQGKHHFCSSKCYYSFNCGSNNGNYKHGKSNLLQNIHLLSTYKFWRKSVFERDNYTCQVCNKTNIYLEVHHKLPILYIFELFDINNTKEALKCKLLWDINNGITLCKSCHNKVHPEKGTRE